MRIHVDLHSHLDTGVESELANLNRKADLIILKMEKFMATLDEVLAKVREADTKQDSITALLNGLKQQVADLLSGTTIPPSVQAKVDELFEAAKHNVEEIDESITANTPPASPEPTPPA